MSVVGDGFFGSSEKLLPSKAEVLHSFFSVAVGAVVSMMLDPLWCRLLLSRLSARYGVFFSSSALSFLLFHSLGNQERTCTLKIRGRRGVKNSMKRLGESLGLLCPAFASTSVSRIVRLRRTMREKLQK